MDNPGNNDRFSPPTNPSAKKKRKTSNTAARRAEGSRFALPGTSNNNSRPDCLLPPAPPGGPNVTLFASNPFDDSPACMSGPPPGYPGAMGFMMMMRPPGMQHQQQQLQQLQLQQPRMNVIYEPSYTSNASASMPRMIQNFGHLVGPMFEGTMMARMPGPRLRLLRGAPPPYPNAPPISGTMAINTLSRMHMSMGNVNVASPAAPAVSMLNNPNINLNLAGMPAPMPMMQPPLISNENKRRAPSLCIDPAPMQPYQPFAFNAAGEIHQRLPMYQLPCDYLDKMSYNKPQPIVPTVPGSSILESRLTRPIIPRRVSIDVSMFSEAGEYPTHTLEQQLPDAVPTPCGGCEHDVYPVDDAVMCGSGCDFWYHRECSELSPAAHHLLFITPFTQWTCNFCFTTKNVPIIKFN